jgi:hypothetical protein
LAGAFRVARHVDRVEKNATDLTLRRQDGLRDKDQHALVVAWPKLAQTYGREGSRSPLGVSVTEESQDLGRSIGERGTERLADEITVPDGAAALLVDRFKYM